MQVWELIEELKKFNQGHTILVNGQPIRTITKDPARKAVRLIPYQEEFSNVGPHWSENDI